MTESVPEQKNGDTADPGTLDRTLSLPMGVRVSLVRFPGVAGALSALLLAACGSGNVDVSNPPFPADAQIEPAGRSLVPADEGPSDLTLETVARDSEFGGGSGGGGWLAVYGNASADDPLEGEVLGIAVQEGVEGGPSLPAGRDQSRLVRSDDTTTWVTWPLADDDQEVDQAAVVGRNLGPDEVQAVAEAVDVRVGPDDSGDEPPTITVPADALSDGMELLAEGPVSLAGFTFGGPSLPHAAHLEWRGQEQAVIQSQAVAEDSALALLLRFGVDDSGGTTIRGRKGAAGPPITALFSPREPQPYYLTWSEAGLVMLVHSLGVDRAEVDSFVAGLRPAEERDWERLADLALQAPPDLYGSPGATHSGIFETGRWALGYSRLGENLVVDVSIELIDGRFGSGSSGTWPVGLHVGVEHIEQGTLVHGYSPPGTVRVRLDLADGSTWEPDLVALETSWPERFFARWEDAPVDVLSAAAYDASGGVIVEGPSDLPPGGDPFVGVGGYSFTAPLG